MKASSRACCVSIAALLCSAPAQAQVFSAMGVKAGINSSNAEIVLSGVESLAFALDTQRRIGWHAAAFAEWFRLPVVSIVTQAEYAQRGFAEEQAITSEDGPIPLGSFALHTRLDYVSLPVLLKLRTSPSGSGAYAIAGPRFDFLVNRQTEYSGDGQLALESSLADVFNDRTVGGTVGFGMTGKALSLPLLLEARYNFDFADHTASEIFDAKNNAVDLWLGITF